MQRSENNNKESFSPAKEKIQDHTQAREQKYSEFSGFTMCLKDAEVMFLETSEKIS